MLPTFITPFSVLPFFRKRSSMHIIKESRKVCLHFLRPPMHPLSVRPCFCISPDRRWWERLRNRYHPNISLYVLEMREMVQLCLFSSHSVCLSHFFPPSLPEESCFIFRRWREGIEANVLFISHVTRNGRCSRPLTTWHSDMKQFRFNSSKYTYACVSRNVISLSLGFPWRKKEEKWFLNWWADLLFFIRND